MSTYKAPLVKGSTDYIKRENEILKSKCQAMALASSKSSKLVIIKLLEKRLVELKEKARNANIFDGQRMELLCAVHEFEKVIEEFKMIEIIEDQGKKERNAKRI